jgi:hypothetical protein
MGKPKDIRAGQPFQGIIECVTYSCEFFEIPREMAKLQKLSGLGTSRL